MKGVKYGKKIINRDYFKEFYDKFMEVRTKKFEGKKFLAYARESKSEIINTAIDNNIEKIRKVFEKDKANDNVLKIIKAKIVKSDEKRKPISDADIRELILADELENTNLNKIDEALVKRCRDKNSEEYVVLGEVQYEVSTALRDQFIQDVFGKLEDPTSMGKIVDEYLMNKDIFLDEWNNAIEDTKKILDEKYKECNFDIDEIIKNIQEPKFLEHSFIMDIGRSISQISVSDIGRSVSKSLSKASGCFGIKSSHSTDSSDKKVEDLSNILGSLKEELATEHQDGEPEPTQSHSENRQMGDYSLGNIGTCEAQLGMYGIGDNKDKSPIPPRVDSKAGPSEEAKRLLRLRNLKKEMERLTNAGFTEKDMSVEARKIYNSLLLEVGEKRSFSRAYEIFGTTEDFHREKNKVSQPSNSTSIARTNRNIN